MVRRIAELDSITSVEDLQLTAARALGLPLDESSRSHSLALMATFIKAINSIRRFADSYIACKARDVLLTVRTSE